MRVNVYKATFEWVKRELGTDDWFVADIEPDEALVAAPDFGSACSLAEEVAKDLTGRRRMLNAQARVRDVVVLHENVELRKEG